VVELIAVWLGGDVRAQVEELLKMAVTTVYIIEQSRPTHITTKTTDRISAGGRRTGLLVERDPQHQPNVLHGLPAIGNYG